MKLVFATQNLNKLEEVCAMLPKQHNIISLADIGCNDDIPENQASIEGNAIQKATYIYTKYGLACFADDTGLEVDALRGAPGVYSARYSCDEFPNLNKEERNAANIHKLLTALESIENRKARFRTVVALIIENKVHTFEGIVDGAISLTPKGSKGFGYDPIFYPDAYTCSFAELGLEEKNTISHRGIAIKKLIEFLNNLK